MPGEDFNYVLNVIHAYSYLTEVGLRYAADVDLLNGTKSKWGKSRNLQYNCHNAKIVYNK